jgi:hypothetical protein
VDNWKNITNSLYSVRRKKVLEEHSLFLNCHIIGLDTGSLVLIVFVSVLNFENNFFCNKIRVVE